MPKKPEEHDFSRSEYTEFLENLIKATRSCKIIWDRNHSISEGLFCKMKQTVENIGENSQDSSSYFFIHILVDGARTVLSVSDTSFACGFVKPTRGVCFYLQIDSYGPPNILEYDYYLIRCLWSSVLDQDRCSSEDISQLSSYLESSLIEDLSLGKKKRARKKAEKDINKEKKARKAKKDLNSGADVVTSTPALESDGKDTPLQEEEVGREISRKPIEIRKKD